MDKERKYLTDLKDTVDEHGLVVNGVAGSHSYTIGMLNSGFPDIMVNIRDHVASCRLLNLIYATWTHNGKFDLSPNSDIIEGRNGENLTIEFRVISHEGSTYADHFGKGIEFYSHFQDYIKTGGPVTWVQVLLPDANGKLPYEEGYDHDFMPQEILEHYESANGTVN